MEFNNFAGFGLLLCGSFMIILTITEFRQGRSNRVYLMSGVCVGAMFVALSSALIFHTVWLQIAFGSAAAVGALVMRRHRPRRGMLG